MWNIKKQMNRFNLFSIDLSINHFLNIGVITLQIPHIK
jgi:hypothetical protein